MEPDTVFKGANAVNVTEHTQLQVVLPSPSRFDPKHIHEDTAGASVAQWLECFANHPNLEDELYEVNVIALESEVSWVESLFSQDALPLVDCKEESFDIVDYTAAQSLIKRFLTTSIAYSMNVMPEADGEAWATSFVESFSEEGTQWFTNFKVLSSDNFTWNSVTNSTFDAMVVGVDRTSGAIGYFLVMDED